MSEEALACDWLPMALFTEIPMRQMSRQAKMNIRVFASPVSDSIRQLKNKIYT